MKVLLPSRLVHLLYVSDISMGTCWKSVFTRQGDVSQEAVVLVTEGLCGSQSGQGQEHHNPYQTEGL